MVIAMSVDIFDNHGPTKLFSGQKHIIVKVLFCFSPYTNLKKIMKTVDANVVGQIGCLNGMRLVLENKLISDEYLNCDTFSGYFQCPGSSLLMFLVFYLANGPKMSYTHGM